MTRRRNFRRIAIRGRHATVAPTCVMAAVFALSRSQGKQIYVTQNVVPSSAAMREIVECAGGKVSTTWQTSSGVCSGIALYYGVSACGTVWTFVFSSVLGSPKCPIASFARCVECGREKTGTRWRSLFGAHRKWTSPEVIQVVWTVLWMSRWARYLPVGFAHLDRHFLWQGPPAVRRVHPARIQ